MPPHNPKMDEETCREKEEEKEQEHRVGGTRWWSADNTDPIEEISPTVPFVADVSATSWTLKTMMVMLQWRMWMLEAKGRRMTTLVAHLLSSHLLRSPRRAVHRKLH